MITYDKNKKRYWSLFVTQFLGAFNDNVLKNAVVIYFTYQAVSVLGFESTGLVAFAGGIYILPMFLFSAFFGELTDFISKSKMIKYSKLLEVFCMFLAAYSLYTRNHEFTIIVLFLMGSQSAIFGPVKYGVLPEITEDPETLLKRTSFFSGSTFLSILLGTILGGFLGNEESINILIFVLLLVAIGGYISSLFFSPLAPGTTKFEGRVFGSTKKILKEVKSQKSLWNLLIGISYFWFFGAGILALIPSLAKDYLNGSEEVATLFLAVFTLFMGLGSVLTKKLSFKKFKMGIPAPYMLLIGVFTVVLSIILFSTQSNPDSDQIQITQFLNIDNSILILVFLSLMSFFGAPYIVAQIAQLQETAPKEKVSLYIGANNIINALFIVASSVLIMIFGALGVSVPGMFLILGLMNIIFSIHLYRLYMPDSIALAIKSITSLFYRVKIHGEENFPKNGPYIIVSNHLSFVDWLFVMLIAPHPVRFVIDKLYYDHPILNFWLKQASLVPIARRKESEETYHKAFDEIENALNANHIIGLFPEGHITHSGEMRRFQPGINKILNVKKVPIVPITLHDLYGSFFSRSGKGVFKKFPNFTRPIINVSVHKVIDGENFNLKECESIVREAYEKRGGPKAPSN